MPSTQKTNVAIRPDPAKYELHDPLRSSSPESSVRKASRSSAAISQSTSLIISFIAMVFVGLGNKTGPIHRLQTIPMRNYPNFLNLMTTFVYIPLSFAYIVPMIKYGRSISHEQRSIPKSRFAVMGSLDSLAGILQVFAATYLDGSILILLSQSAIPISMFLSKLLLGARYTAFQYFGAVMVAIGIVIVLEPSLSDSSSDTSYQDSLTVVWAMAMIFSCVPMCLSSIYKERVLGEVDLDPVYLNGWIAIFQFLLSIPLTVPAALVGDPSVPPSKLVDNILDGGKCYMGINTVHDGPHPDHCEKATLYVTLYLVFNVTYNILILLILKYGSANILWLAMTIMVPLGNIAFSLPFMPENVPLEGADIAGLIVIMIGLFIYRFLADLFDKYFGRAGSSYSEYPTARVPNTDSSSMKQSLLGADEDDELDVTV